MIQKTVEKERNIVEYVTLIIYFHRGYHNRSLLNVTVFWLITHLELSDHGHILNYFSPQNMVTTG